MAYRDLSRVVAHDDAEPDEAPDLDPRPRGLKFVRPMARLDLRRVAAALLLMVSLLAVLFYAGGHALRSAVEWLHRQPQYQLPFVQIELLDPPPAWFRGGTAGFLERVRANANEVETLPLLDVDPARIERAFKLFPWVEEVRSIDFPPRGLVVGLSYREPVAQIRLDAERQYVLNGDGLILPSEDVESSKLAPLMQISPKSLVAPSRDRVGKVWATVSDPEADPDRAALDRNVIQAAQLSRFLLDPSRRAEADANPALKIFHIHASRPAGLFVQNTEQTLIFWGRGPGAEEPGELSAPEKWGALVEQAKKGGMKLANRQYWIFTSDGLQKVVSQ